MCSLSTIPYATNTPESSGVQPFGMQRITSADVEAVTEGGRMRSKWVLGMVLGLLVAPAMGYAADSGETKLTLSLTKDYTASPWTSEMGYGKRAMGKLGFGVKNLLLGWTDLFIEPKEAMDAGENVFKGILVGVKDGLENELGGVVHIVTFPLPQIDAPLPEGGTQLLK